MLVQIVYFNKELMLPIFWSCLYFLIAKFHKSGRGWSAGGFCQRKAKRSISIVLRPPVAPAGVRPPGPPPPAIPSPPGDNPPEYASFMSLTASLTAAVST